MAGKTSLQQTLAETRRGPRRKKRLSPELFLAASAFFLLLVLLFLLFVPVELKVRYEGPIHQYGEIDDNAVRAAAVTLSGREYEVSHFYKSSASVGAEEDTVTIRWAWLSAHLPLKPVAFSHYTAAYNGTFYQGDPLDPARLTVSAVFEDGQSRALAPEEYTFRALSEGKGGILVDSAFGEGRVEELPMVRFSGYRIDGPTAYEGDAIRAEDYTVTALFEDGCERPLEARPTLSDTVARNTTQVSVSAPFGSYTGPISYIPLATVEPDADFTRFELVYADGRRTAVEPREDYADFAAPRLLSCRVEDGRMVVELEGDSRLDCVYALFAADGSTITGACLGAAWGRGASRIEVPFRGELLRMSYRVVSITPQALSRMSEESRAITNPEALSERTGLYPQQPTKKGLQIDPGYMGDVTELSLRHAVVNIPMDKLLGSGFVYSYEGTDYTFNKEYIDELDAQFRTLGQAGVTTTAVLLMRYTSPSIELIYPAGRAPGYTFYGLNMTTPEARHKLAAIFSLLAERYANDTYKVFNWILGNEVGNYTEWNWCGEIGLEEYIRNYAASFRLLYNITRSISADAHCLISLDHCWNETRKGAFTTREVLDAFAAELAREGDIDWWVAYHAYSEPLSNAAFWKPNAKASGSIDTARVVTMMNLKTLTDYVENTYGPEHRFILSENGFSSTQGWDTQAAAIAYAYYLAEANDMVDSIAIHRHLDDGVEMAQGLHFGLRQRGGTPKQSYEVFKTMDTDPAAAGFALGIIGGESWEELLARAGYQGG